MDVKPLLSIVIIAYNAKDTIAKPINSILKQSALDPKKHIELIIVDDQSTDDMKKICDLYESKFLKYTYHVLTKNNHKLGALRYAGTCLATGQWITYLDADDAFIDNTLHFFTNQINNELNPVGIFTHEKYIPFEEGFAESDTFSNGHLHGKFYNMSFMKKYNINFLENMVFEEDLYFNMTYITTALLYDYTLLEVHEQTYCYYGSAGSICNNAINQSINTGILYPDHHLLHFDDYMYASTVPTLNVYKKDPQKFYKSVMSVIFSIYYTYNFYIFVRHQFENVSDDFFTNFIKTKCLIRDFFNKLPKSVYNINSIEQFAFDNPNEFLAPKSMIDNLYKPGGRIVFGFCPQSLHEFLTEFLLWQ